MKSENFDPESLLHRVDGDLELLRELEELFTTQVPRMLARIEEAIKNESPSELEKAGHKVKGTVLQFSAQAAAAAALQLEDMGRLGSTSGAEAVLENLIHEINLVQRALRAMLNGEGFQG